MTGLPEGLLALALGAGMLAAVNPCGFADEQLSVAGSSAAQVGELAASSGIVLHELVKETPTLEDAFLAITREEEG